MRMHTALPTALVCLTLITSSCTTVPTHPASFAGSAAFAADADPLPSWNDGPAKKAILDFVKTTTDKNNPKFVPPEGRIATFDQDGTTWVSHPIYSQVLFTFDRVAALAPKHPEWKTTQPFQAVLAGDKEAMAKFTLKDIEILVFATHTGMATEAFQPIVKDWITKAKHPRFHRPYSQMVYQPMLEVMSYLRRQRLQNLHRDRRRPGLRPRVRAAGLRNPSGTGDRFGAYGLYTNTRMEGAS